MIRDALSQVPLRLKFVIPGVGAVSRKRGSFQSGTRQFGAVVDGRESPVIQHDVRRLDLVVFQFEI
jgi:hypothetical protein